jgi:hypothetical protein
MDPSILNLQPHPYLAETRTAATGVSSALVRRQSIGGSARSARTRTGAASSVEVCISAVTGSGGVRQGWPAWTQSP